MCYVRGLRDIGYTCTHSNALKTQQNGLTCIKTQRTNRQVRHRVSSRAAPLMMCDATHVGDLGWNTTVTWGALVAMVKFGNPCAISLLVLFVYF